MKSKLLLMGLAVGLCSYALAQESDYYKTDERVTVPADLGVEKADSFKNEAYSYKVETLQFGDSVSSLNSQIKEYKAQGDEADLNDLQKAYTEATGQNKRAETLLNKGVDLISKSGGVIKEMKSVRPLKMIPKATKMSKESANVLNEAKNELTEASKILPENIKTLGEILTDRGVNLDDLKQLAPEVPSLDN